MNGNLSGDVDVDVLEEKIEDLEDEVADLRRYKWVVAGMVDRLAMIGLIESDPHSKLLYREGRKSI